MVLDRITSKLAVMCRAYVALIVLVTVLPMAWYKAVMQRSLGVYHGGISHESQYTSCVYGENSSDWWRNNPRYTTPKRCITIIY